MSRSETRVTWPRELYREVAKAAKSEQRTIAEWIRLACKKALGVSAAQKTKETIQ